MIPADLREKFGDSQRLILADVEDLVRLESPSRDRLALEALKAVLVERLRMLPAAVRVVPNEQEGDHVLAQFPGPTARRPALVLGHYDTVWPAGTIQTMPFRTEDGR